MSSTRAGCQKSPVGPIIAGRLTNSKLILIYFFASDNLTATTEYYGSSLVYSRLPALTTILAIVVRASLSDGKDSAYERITGASNVAVTR